MTAHEQLCALRWPDGVACPHCGAVKPYWVATRDRFNCSSKLCRRQFTVMTGTIFKHRKMPLETYLLALDIFPTIARPVEMQQALKVDYRTAFSIFRALEMTGGKMILENSK